MRDKGWPRTYMRSKAQSLDTAVRKFRLKPLVAYKPQIRDIFEFQILIEGLEDVNREVLEGTDHIGDCNSRRSESRRRQRPKIDPSSLSCAFPRPLQLFLFNFELIDTRLSKAIMVRDFEEHATLNKILRREAYLRSTTPSRLCNAVL